MLKGVNHITFSVSDLDRAFDFYTAVLSCRPLAKWQRGAYLLAGETWLCLSLDAQTRKNALAEYSHIAFSVEKNDFKRVAELISASGATIWKENTSEGDSLYFLDPDGHKLEVHASDWQSRLEAVKIEPYDGMEFFV